MSENQLETRQRIEMEILGDERDPKSLGNIMPPMMQEAAKSITEKEHKMSDVDLGQSISVGAKRVMFRLRESFWIQYHFAASSGRKINLAQVYFGVCSTNEMKRYCEKPAYIAFILRPPQNYEIAMKTALSRSVDVMSDILDADNVNPKTGMLDPKIADVQRRLFENLSDRVKGMPIQRTENLNYNKEVGANVDTGNASVTKEDIDEKIRKLEEEMAPVKDVTPK